MQQIPLRSGPRANRCLRLIAAVALCVPALSVGQQSDPFTPDSLTRGLWHFNETTGSSVFDSSATGITGFAAGATIVPGRFGNARAFNGVSDYIYFPPDSAFDFGNSSFRIDLWFKTGGQPGGILLRRGLAPVPGYQISMANGRVVGMIGNREDSSWPDTLISVWSDSTFDDNQWHLATMIRDRSIHKLLLFIDGTLAAQPSEDPFTIPLTNSRPLTIGRWENDSYPWFFYGAVDEVRLSTFTPRPPGVVIHVTPPLLDFGKVRVGSVDSLLLTIANGGDGDTLRISSIASNNPRFGVPGGPLRVPAGQSLTVPVRYSPLSVSGDTGLVSIASNDSIVPLFTVKVFGKGYVLKPEPVIGEVAVVPYTYYQLRVRWFRSLYDSAGATDPVTEYSVWRSLPGVASLPAGNSPGPFELPASSVNGSSWEFLAMVPALRFDEYSCVVPAVVDYTRRETQNVVMVAARTEGLQVFTSRPDTILVDPPGVTGVGGPESRQVPKAFVLEQNFPNPFNPSTTIRYALPHGAVVTLLVHNVLGQEVARLVDGYQSAGYHDVQFGGTALASGIYLCRLQAGDFTATKRLLLLK